MYLGSPEHYLEVGLSAVTCIEAAAGVMPGATGEFTPGRILDFACGFGRVQRFLRARWPDADITAAEIQPRALRFCARHFGSNSQPVPADPLDLKLPGEFDLIFVGSLFTHMDEKRTDALLARFREVLAPGGLLLATTHGDQAAAHDWTIKPLAPEDRKAVLAAYRQGGFAWAPYPGSPVYGVSLSSVDWMRARGEAQGLEMIWSGSGAWGNHQDALGFTPRI